MLIRSQDNKTIINLDNVESISVSTLDSSAVIWCGSRLVAEYGTEEKAIKTLDMLERAYRGQDIIAFGEIAHKVEHSHVVFQMPADDEVEDD